jgi:hypothetical protein
LNALPRALTVTELPAAVTAAVAVTSVFELSELPSTSPRNRILVAVMSTPEITAVGFVAALEMNEATSAAAIAVFSAPTTSEPRSRSSVASRSMTPRTPVCISSIDDERVYDFWEMSRTPNTAAIIMPRMAMAISSSGRLNPRSLATTRKCLVLMAGPRRSCGG